MSELIKDFEIDTHGLIGELETLLSDIEVDFEQKSRLNDFAQTIDTIMGSAQSLATFGYEQEEIKKLGDFAELCKQIGYRGANVNDKNFYNVTIAFLWDSIESMKKLLTTVGEENQSMIFHAR